MMLPWWWELHPFAKYYWPTQVIGTINQWLAVCCHIAAAFTHVWHTYMQCSVYNNRAKQGWGAPRSLRSDLSQFRMFTQPVPKYRGPGKDDVKGSVCYFWKFALPPFSPPLPSVVQFSKHNRHWTFEIRINFTPPCRWCLWLSGQGSILFPKVPTSPIPHGARLLLVSSRIPVLFDNKPWGEPQKWRTSSICYQTKLEFC